MGSDIVFYGFYVDRITCLMRDDSMSPVFPGLSHVRCHTGAYSVSEDLYGFSQSGAYREPSSQLQAWMIQAHLIFRHVTFLMPHWGIFPILIEIYRSPLVYMIIHGYEIHASFGVQSHHHHFLVSAFRAIIGFQSDVQSRHHHFLVSAFRAIIGFQIDIQSRILGFDVQSRYRFSASAFRAIIGFQIDIQSRVLGFGVQSRYHSSASVFRAIVITVFSVRRSEPSSVFRSTFRVTSSVSVFRVVITFQFGVQSHYRHLV
uniref:Uncharacterized protein n=1 Tax=Vitis vinifera TaxID=29760 RepID=A5BKA1_VITVI|nr:hypothetical protein VITISV_017564 [Vitis vinifera]